MNGIDVNVKVKRENNHEINVMEAEMMRLKGWEGRTETVSITTTRRRGRRPAIPS